MTNNPNQTTTPQSVPLTADVPPAIASLEKVIHLQHQVNATAQIAGRFKKSFGVSLSVSLFSFLFSWILAFCFATYSATGKQGPWLVVGIFIAFGLCLVAGLCAMSHLQAASNRLDEELRACASAEALEEALQKYLDEAQSDGRLADEIAMRYLIDNYDAVETPEVASKKTPETA